MFYNFWSHGGYKICMRGHKYGYDIFAFLNFLDSLSKRTDTIFEIRQY